MFSASFLPSQLSLSTALLSFSLVHQKLFEKYSKLLFNDIESDHFHQISIKKTSNALSIIIKINRLNPFSWLPPWRVSDFIFMNFFISLFFTVEKLFLFIWREKLETINFIALSCSTFILFILPIARSLRHKSGIKISLKVDWVN